MAVIVVLVVIISYKFCGILRGCCEVFCVVAGQARQSDQVETEYVAKKLHCGHLKNLNVDFGVKLVFFSKNYSKSMFIEDGLRPQNGWVRFLIRFYPCLKLASNPINPTNIYIANN
jgi:hypothetical protein